MRVPDRASGSCVGNNPVYLSSFKLQGADNRRHSTGESAKGLYLATVQAKLAREFAVPADTLRKQLASKQSTSYDELLVSRPGA